MPAGCWRSVAGRGARKYRGGFVGRTTSVIRDQIGEALPAVLQSCADRARNARERGEFNRFPGRNVCRASQLRRASGAESAVPVIGQAPSRSAACSGQSTDQRAEIGERHGHHHGDADGPFDQGRRTRRLRPPAPPVNQRSGPQATQESEHAEGRQEEPDAVMARRVRQPLTAASGMPNVRRSRDRSAQSASFSAPSTSRFRPGSRSRPG